MISLAQKDFDGLIAALRSNEYVCPGEHRLDGGRGNPYEYPEEMMVELGYPECWSYDEMARRHPGEYQHLLRMMERNWVDTGKCREKITITLETEDSYAYLVADGPCVQALGLDEDDYTHPIWQRVMERRKLRALIPVPDFRVESYVWYEEAPGDRSLRHR